METMYQRGKIQEESLYYETLKHTGEYPIIGVNTFKNSKGSPTIIPNEIITTKEDFYKIKIEAEKLIKNLTYSGIEWRPKSSVNLKNGEKKEIESMLELLEDEDDVQKVFHNCKFF